MDLLLAEGPLHLEMHSCVPSLFPPCLVNDPVNCLQPLFLEQVRTCPSHLSSHLSSPRSLKSNCKHVIAFQVCKRVDLTCCVYTQMWILQNIISPGLYASLCS